MAQDPLKTFRQRVLSTGASAPPVRAPAPSHPRIEQSNSRIIYQACGAKDKISRLDIRCASGLAHALSYNYLLNISYDRKTYSEIFLTVSGLTVTIRGKNLKPAVDSLKLQTCEFLQEFDANEFYRPDAGTAIIESINVEVMRGAPPEHTPSKRG